MAKTLCSFEHKSDWNTVVQKIQVNSQLSWKVSHTTGWSTRQQIEIRKQ